MSRLGSLVLPLSLRGIAFGKGLGRQPSSHSLQGTWEYNKQKHDDVLDDLHGAYAGILLAAFEVRPCRVAHPRLPLAYAASRPGASRGSLGLREERCSVDRLWLEII
jgi:hypothetical protein